MNPSSATDLLIAAADAIGDRAAARDLPDGERSMKRAVTAFNALYGARLTELQGWQFMVLLKLSRSAVGRVDLDDFTDAAAYAALAGECAQRARATRHASVSLPLHGFAAWGCPPAAAVPAEKTGAAHGNPPLRQP